MPAGIQLFHADGSINVDTSTGIPRYLGVTDPAWSGSINVPEWATQRPWIVVHRDSITRSPLNVDYLTVSVSGTTLTWNCPPTSAVGQPRISYGCF